MLINLNSYIYEIYLPLTRVIDLWKIQNIERLKQEYLLTVEGKLPLTEEEMIALQKRWSDISS